MTISRKQNKQNKNKNSNKSRSRWLDQDLICSWPCRFLANWLPIIGGKSTKSIKVLIPLGSNIDLLCFLPYPHYLMKQSWISINPDYCQFQMTELALFYGTKTLILSPFTALMPGTWTRNIGPKTRTLGLDHFFVTRPIPLNWSFQVSPWKMLDPTNAELISNLVKP